MSTDRTYMEVMVADTEEVCREAVERLRQIAPCITWIEEQEGTDGSDT